MDAKLLYNDIPYHDDTEVVNEKLNAQTGKPIYRHKSYDQISLPNINS